MNNEGKQEMLQQRNHGIIAHPHPHMFKAHVRSSQGHTVYLHHSPTMFLPDSTVWWGAYLNYWTTGCLPELLPPSLWFIEREKWKGGTRRWSSECICHWSLLLPEMHIQEYWSISAVLFHMKGIPGPNRIPPHMEERYAHTPECALSALGLLLLFQERNNKQCVSRMFFLPCIHRDW